MTKISFERSNGVLYRVTVTGHSGYAEAGSDIVCAAISQTVNTASAILTAGGCEHKVSIGKLTPTVILELCDTENAVGKAVLEGVFQTLTELAGEYSDNVKVTAVSR